MNKDIVSSFIIKASLAALSILMSATAKCGVADTWGLFETGIPVVFIETVNRELPTADPVDPPEGCSGGGITNRTIVKGRIYILNANKDTIYDSGEYQESESGMTVRLRGNWSGRLEKAPYKIKLEKKADLIDGNRQNADRNWILKNDENMYPNVIASLKVNELSGMQWTPRYKWVHLVMNNTYRGLYQLIESVRRNPDCRIDVSKSGYIIEYDAYWWNEDVWFETPLHQKWSNMNYTFKYPDSEDITREQIQYISDYMTTVESSINDGTYTQYIDVESFARWLLGADILGMGDGAGFNMYITKYDNTSESLIRMSNLWDYDTMMKKKGEWSRSHTFYYFPALFASSDRTFTETYIRIWEEEGHFIMDSTINYIKSYISSEQGESLAKSLAKDNKRWPYYYVDLAEYADSVISWFEQRKVWMDNEIAKLKAEASVVLPGGVTGKVQYYDLLGRRVNDYEGKRVKYSKDGLIGIVF